MPTETHPIETGERLGPPTGAYAIIYARRPFWQFWKRSRVPKRITIEQAVDMCLALSNRVADANKRNQP